MTNRIIVGVDGSAPSTAALRWATFEARRRNATLVAFSCFGVPVYGSPEGAIYPTTDDIDVFKEAATAIVNTAMEAVAAIDHGVAVEGVTAMAPAAVAIADEARPGD